MKPKKRKLGANSLSIIQQSVGRGKGGKKAKNKAIVPEKIKSHTGKDPNNEQTSMLDFVVKDILKDMSHPTKLQYWNLNRTYSMQKMIEEKIKILLKSDEYSNKDKEYLIIQYTKIFNDYGKEIRQQSKDLIEVWENIERRTHDKEMLKIFSNIKQFVEFLADKGEFKLLRDFQEHIQNKGYKVEDDD